MEHPDPNPWLFIWFENYDISLIILERIIQVNPHDALHLYTYCKSESLPSFWWLLYMETMLPCSCPIDDLIHSHSVQPWNVGLVRPSFSENHNATSQLSLGTTKRKANPFINQLSIPSTLTFQKRSRDRKTIHIKQKRSIPCLKNGIHL